MVSVVVEKLYPPFANIWRSNYDWEYDIKFNNTIKPYRGREKGISYLNLSIINISSWHTVIETCFEILKSWRYSSYKFPQFYRLFWSFTTGPPISIYYPFRIFSIPWLWCKGLSALFLKIPYNMRHPIKNLNKTTYIRKKKMWNIF